MLLTEALAAANQPGAWATQMIGAEEAQKRGQFAVAEAGFDCAIRIAMETHPNEPAYEGASENELGQLYFIEGKFALAEKLFLRALARFREIGDDAKQGRVAANLSTLYLEIGQFSRAEVVIRPYMDLPSGAIEVLDWAMLSSNLGSVRELQGRPQEAEKLFRAVIEGLQYRRDADGNIVRATTMDDLAGLLVKTGRQTEGEALAYNSLDILEGFAASCPANVIKALTNVAEFKIAGGDLAGARALLERAMAVYESAFQTDQQLLGVVLRRYAVVLRAEKKNAAARKAERRAAQILVDSQRENQLGYTVEAKALK